MHVKFFHIFNEIGAAVSFYLLHFYIRFNLKKVLCLQDGTEEDVLL